ncbi:MAG: SDR family oxidoreductase [Clostridia bacterium]|nr:SDR family oxidoreductase [Clostridia bacterium]
MDKEMLAGKAGIVTGGSSGIGFQIANVLAESGATVYVISRTGAPKEGVGESAPGVVHLKGDIGNREEMEAVIADIAARHNGAIDFLVNNAGISYKCRAEQFPEDRFDAIMATNVKYVFSMCTLCFPYLKKSADKGRIINITSMSAHLGFSEVVPYCASKGAVLAMTRGLAVEWAGDNICVNSIAPGWFRSKMTEQVVDAAREQKILSRMPLHQYGDTRDLGSIAAYLCGPAAGYITGQDFAVDGGALAFGY